MIDDYLAFCERALLKPEDGQGGERNLLGDHFPIARRNSVHEAAPTIEEAPGYPKCRSNKPHKDDDEKHVMRPGESYTIYNSLDAFGTSAEEYELVVSRAARWVAVTENFLSRVVEKFERRVVRWWNIEKKTTKERGGGRGGRINIKGIL